MATKLPIIDPIPAEVHARAMALGLVAETFTVTAAGHGPTGQIGWSLSTIATHGDWTDKVAILSGTSSLSEHAHAAMRDALAWIEAQP